MLERPDKESLHLQLSEVHIRARMHAERLWQLPFSYVGVVGVSAALLKGGGGEQDLSPLFLLYIVFGILVSLAMISAFEGVLRALGHMIRIEGELGLVVTTEIKKIQILGPHLLLVVATLIASIVWYLGT